MGNMIPDLKMVLDAEGIRCKIPNPEVDAKYFKLERGGDGAPTFIIQPENEQQLQKSVELLNKFKIPMTIFAGGTGLVGAQRAQDTAVLDLNKMDQMISVELKNGDKFNFSEIRQGLGNAKAQQWQDEFDNWVKKKNYTKQDCVGAVLECQAGVPANTAKYVLKNAGIEIAIATGAMAEKDLGAGMTVGAGVANATHGMFGVREGTMSDLTEEVVAINGNGSIRVDKGVGQKQRVIPEDKTVINSAIPQYGDSSIGTQGSFSVISSVKLRTSPIPEQLHYYLVKTDSLAEVNQLRKNIKSSEFSPYFRECEVMNQLATDNVMKFMPDFYINPFSDENGNPMSKKDSFGSKYTVMLGIVCDKKEPADLGFGFYEYLTSLGYPDNKIAYANEDVGTSPTKFLDLRESCSQASAPYLKTIGSPIEHRVSPDVSVPLDRLDSYADTLLNQLEGKGYKVNIFGHIGIGAFHLHVYTPKDKPLSEEVASGVTRKTELMNLIYDITQQHEGSCWSEHGVGSDNGSQWAKRTPKDQVNLWLAMKLQYDPNNICNPGSFDWNKNLDKLKNSPELQAEIEKIAKVNSFKATLEYLYGLTSSKADSKSFLNK